MKNTMILSLIVVFLFSSLSSFSQKKEVREVSDFTKVSFGVSGTVHFTQGSPQKLEIEADEKVLDNLKTEVTDGRLRIKFDNWKLSSMKPITIWITVPEVDGLYVSGSGKITAENQVKAEEIALKISGSGKIELADFTAEEVDVSISGSGNLKLAGSGEEMEVSISGSGHINAQSFTVSECQVSISGSGGAKINATSKLNARISGSGNVYYSGNPQIDASVSGSGKVRKGD